MNLSILTRSRRSRPHSLVHPNLRQTSFPVILDTMVSHGTSIEWMDDFVTTKTLRLSMQPK